MLERQQCCNDFCGRVEPTVSLIFCKLWRGRSNAPWMHMATRLVHLRARSSLAALSPFLLALDSTLFSARRSLVKEVLSGEYTTPFCLQCMAKGVQRNFINRVSFQLSFLPGQPFFYSWPVKYFFLLLLRRYFQN